jgi:hypothetical protein
LDPVSGVIGGMVHLALLGGNWVSTPTRTYAAPFLP